MRPRFRSLLALALALVLVLTGQGMAVARGMSGPDGTMVICTGAGPVTVYVDADGTPMAPPHICPDCALSLIQTGVGGDPALYRPGAVTVWRVALPQIRARGQMAVTAQARGPPGPA